MSDAATPYLGIIAILAESYSLDSVWSLASATSLSISGSPSSFIFTTNDSTIKVCDLPVVMMVLI